MTSDGPAVSASPSLSAVWQVVMGTWLQLSFQRLLAKLQSWERLDQTMGLNLR